MKYLIILTILITGCVGYFSVPDDYDFWNDPLRQNVSCPEGEHCLDLTEKMGGMEGTIFEELKPIKGWRQIGCIHSKQLDPSTVIEQMYCEYCNKEDHQMWMIYDYGNETWNMDDQEWLNICGTPHPLYNKER